jgi:hypothetical protein
MPVFGYFNLESSSETNGIFTAIMVRVKLDQEDINAGIIKRTILRMPHLTYRYFARLVQYHKIGILIQVMAYNHTLTGVIVMMSKWLTVACLRYDERHGRT